MKSTKSLLSATLLLCVLALCYAGEATPKARNRDAAAAAFVAKLAKGDFAGAAANFDAAMKQALPPAELKKTWEGLVSQMGPFERQLGVRGESAGGFDAVHLTCRFGKGVIDAKVVFDAKGRISGLWFAPGQAPSVESSAPLPNYLKSDAFEEAEVTVGDGSVALPGTLTLPKGEGPFPAVVLVHGSGPNDRDETIGPNKPFRDLAWGLAGNGIAVLRYDKRTKVLGPQAAAAIDKLTVKEEVIDDALSAARLLRGDKRIDAKRVYLLGHSWGGYLAPRMAAQDRDIAGLIIIAGTSRPLPDVMLEQVRYISSLDGKVNAEEKASLAELDRQAAQIKDPNLATAQLAPRTLLMGAPRSYWLDLRGYDCVGTAHGLSQPILILRGERDYQVTGNDWDQWYRGLSAKANVTLKSYPSLNHLFMKGKGPGTPAEYEQPGHVSEQVIDDISRWIKEQRTALQGAATEAKR